MIGNKAAAPTVNMLWIGEALGPIERLSAVSWLAGGHPVRLHAYGLVAGVPEGVEMADGERTVPLADMKRLRHRKTGSYALASDWFRYRLQHAGAGLWSDLDVVCLKPVRLPGDCLFGLQDDDFINGAVLYLAPELAMTHELQDIFRDDFIPPWTIMKRARKALLKRLLGLRVTPADLPWGTYGPSAITWLARRHGLFERALPPSVLYPLDYRDARTIFDPAASLDGIVKEDTLTLHLWNERLRDLRHSVPPRGSPLARLYREFGI